MNEVRPFNAPKQLSCSCVYSSSSRHIAKKSPNLKFPRENFASQVEAMDVFREFPSDTRTVFPLSTHLMLSH